MAENASFIGQWLKTLLLKCLCGHNAKIHWEGDNIFLLCRFTLLRQNGWSGHKGTWRTCLEWQKLCLFHFHSRHTGTWMRGWATPCSWSVSVVKLAFVVWGETLLDWNGLFYIHVWSSCSCSVAPVNPWALCSECNKSERGHASYTHPTEGSTSAPFYHCGLL